MVGFAVTARKNLWAWSLWSGNTVDTALGMQIYQLHIVNILRNPSFNNAVSACDIY